MNTTVTKILVIIGACTVTQQLVNILVDITRDKKELRKRVDELESDSEIFKEFIQEHLEVHQGKA